MLRQGASSGYFSPWRSRSSRSGGRPRQAESSVHHRCPRRPAGSSSTRATASRTRSSRPTSRSRARTARSRPRWLRPSQFILSQHGWKAGKYKIGFQSCDDSTAQAGSWDSGEVHVERARLRQQRRHGRPRSGRSTPGAPSSRSRSLNRRSGGPIPMVSPSNTYPGLTVGGPGTASGEPNIYYPSGQAELRPRRVDRPLPGRCERALREAARPEEGLRPERQGDVRPGHRHAVHAGGEEVGITIAGFQGWDKDATSYESLASRSRTRGADGVFLGGIVCNNGGKLIKDLRGALGNERRRSSGLTAGRRSRRRSRARAPRPNGMYISQPGIPIDQLKGAGKKFADDFAKTQRRQAPGSVHRLRGARRPRCCSTRSGSPTAAASRRLGEAVQDGRHGRHPRATSRSTRTATRRSARSPSADRQERRSSAVVKLDHPDLSLVS